VAFAALAGLVHDGRLGAMQLDRVDGVATASSPWRAALEAAGFRSGYRGLVLRAART
jgi:hypothetical protein